MYMYRRAGALPDGYVHVRRAGWRRSFIRLIATIILHTIIVLYTLLYVYAIYRSFIRLALIRLIVTINIIIIIIIIVICCQ